MVEYAGAKHVADPRLAKARRQIAAWLDEPRRNITDHDLRALREIAEMTALFFELERITPISVTTPVMHATMIDSIKNCLQRSRCPSSGGSV
ncbi:MAG: hypothetical protein IKF96_02100 [Eggerthellaceae bacterium]|nr:hypothetical protein [Eggerthellaceae bacterium]